jgi:hypothetical protein
MPGRIEKMGASPNVRAALFYGVCIWVRVGITVGVMYIARAYFVPTMIAVLVAAILYSATEFGLTLTNNPVWWSRAAHGLIGAIIAITAIIALATRRFSTAYAISFFMLLDTAIGIVLSFARKPFRTQRKNIQYAIA